MALGLFSGCTGEGDLKEESTLHYAQMDEPKRLDPAFVKDLYEGIVSGFLYDGLVIFTSGDQVQPGLAPGAEPVKTWATRLKRLRQGSVANSP